MSGAEFARQTQGWYPDPVGRAEQRYWSGDDWTPWVSDGNGVTVDPGPLRRRITSADAGHLAFVRDVFLPEARALGVVEDVQAEALVELMRTLAGQALPPKPTVAPIPVREPPRRSAAPYARTEGRDRPAGTSPPRVVAPASPGAFARWWERSREAVGSDLATHGLAYLGVVLLFVGVFGLVAFAFGDVAPNARPVAELAIAATPFLAAAMLLRRGAEIAGRALELAGGMLVPIMAVTTFVDGVDVPPDVSGTALVVALTTVLLGISGLYAIWTSRHPASALRFLVAPVGWLAAAMATMGVGRAVPSGDGVAVATAAQVTAIAASIVLSLVAARVKSAGRLSRPTLTAAVPGVCVTALLGLLTWSSESWPVIPIALTGFFGLAALDLLDGRLSGAVVAIAQPLWWAVVALALVPGLDPGPAGALAAVGFVLLLENNGRRRPGTWPLGLALAGLVLALAATWTAPWWAVTTFAVLSIWAVYRRTAPFAVPGSSQTLDLAAILLPIGAVEALGIASDRAVVSVAAAASLVLLSTVPAVRPVLRRGAEDDYWTWWWRGGLVGVAALAAGTTEAFPAAGTADQWLLTGAVAALAASSAVGPIPSVWRPWPVLALATWAWFLACATISAPDAVRGGLVGGVALALVGAAHVFSGRMASALAGSIGLAGHALALVALVAAGSGWGLVITTGLATAGFLVTTWYDGRDRSPVGTLLAGTWDELLFAPPALGALGLPLTVGLALDAGGALPFTDPWAPAVFAVTAVVYAAAARRARVGRVSVTLAWGAFTAGVLAAATSAEPWPAAVGLLALMVAVRLLPERRRSPVMVWVAWAALAPFVGLLAVEALPWLADQPEETEIAATLVTVGGIMAITVAAGDLRGRRWEPRLLPSRSALLPVLVTGGAELAIGLLIALTVVPAREGGWLTAAVAGIALILALLSRVGLLGGVAGVLGWVAVLMLAGDTISDLAWISIAATVALLVAAELSHRVVPDPRWWVRADVPLLVVAHLTAVTALVAAADSDGFAATSVCIGALALAVAGRLRSVRFLSLAYAVVGWVLVISGAASAGSGWLALALLALAAAMTTSAVRADGPARWALQVGGAIAVVGAWLAALDWFSWATQTSVDTTAVGAGAVALAWAVVARRGWLDRSWALSWGAVAALTATLLAGCAALPSVWDGRVEVSAWTSVALLLVAVALAVAATPLAAAWMRDLTAVFVLASGLEALSLSGVSSGWQVAVLGGTSLACALALVVVSSTTVAAQPLVVWRRPLLVLGLATSLAALAVGVAALPETALLVPGLLVAAVQSATLGIVLRSTAAQVLSPMLACAAWVVFAAEALGGSAQWYTVPLGLTILVVVALVRRDARGRGADPAAAGIVALELVGIGFVVGAALVQSVTTSLAYTALALALGLAVAAWGTVTRVRRRVAAGAVVVLVALVLLVAVPLVELLPAWSGALLWVCIAGFGVLALVAATLLEQSRSAVRRAVKGFGEMTEGWE